MSSKAKYPCAWCGKQWLKLWPAPIEAVCWECWYEEYGKAQAVREWKRKHWWRRLIP